MKTERGKKERRAAGNTYYHHPHSFLETENISGGDLMKELHPLPDKSDVFKQDALARERRLRSDKLCRHALQRGKRRYDGNAYRAKERCGQSKDKQRYA